MLIKRKRRNKSGKNFKKKSQTINGSKKTRNLMRILSITNI